MNMKDGKIFTIPNLLTLLRIISVPIYTYFLVASKGTNLTYVYIAFGILVASASTDLFDGYIARRFNQVSDLGKLLDPVADKLMSVAALIGLTVIGYIHWAFVALIAFKEGMQLLFGLFLLKKKIIVPANIFGKIAMWALSLGIMLAFFHPVMAEYVFHLDWIILGIGVAIAFTAFVNYAIIYFRKLKAAKEGATDAPISGNGEEQNGQDL